MDKTVPAGAALLLDFIGKIEAPQGYGTIYANKQASLPKPLTAMTIDEVIAAGPSWKRNHGSSAAGRYQFMNATLKGLKSELGLRGSQVLDADLQDRLGYHLLKRRGYDRFMSGSMDVTEFAKSLAKEWASLPVLSDTQGAKRAIRRGQSYYAGDGLNKSLTSPEAVSKALNDALLAVSRPATDRAHTKPLAPPPDAPMEVPARDMHQPEPEPDGTRPWVLGLFIVAVIVVAALVFFFHGATPNG